MDSEIALQSPSRTRLKFGRTTLRERKWRAAGVCVGDDSSHARTFTGRSGAGKKYSSSPRNGKSSKMDCQRMQSRVRDKQEVGRNQVADKLEIVERSCWAKMVGVFCYRLGIFTRAKLLLVKNLDLSIVCYRPR